MQFMWRSPAGSDTAAGLGAGPVRLKRRTHSLAVGLLAVAVIGVGAGSLPALAQDPSSPADFDRAFIDMMVPHHESAVAMAQAALARSERPEILALAPEIIKAQEYEIAQLRSWRQEWYGDDDTPPITAMPVLPGIEMPGMETMAGMDPVPMDMAEDVLRLWTTTEPFDLEFIDAMVPHHESAIAAAEIALDQSERSEVIAMAQAIVDSQQAEIDQMTAWRVAWYP